MYSFFIQRQEYVKTRSIRFHNETWNRLFDLCEGCVKAAQNSNKLCYLSILSAKNIFNRFDLALDVDDIILTPNEFKRAKAGDSEDFAVARFCHLLESGAKDDDIFIWFVYNNETKKRHAVVLLKQADNKFIVIMDKHRCLYTYDYFSKKYTSLFFINRLGFGVGNPVRKCFKLKFKRVKNG